MRIQTFGFQIATLSLIRTPGWFWENVSCEIQYSSGTASFFEEDLGNGVSLEMVSIPAGEFIMGSPPTEEGREDFESPQHLVKVPAFFMGKFLVTQAQWAAVAKLPIVNRYLDPDPSFYKGARRPVEDITWFDAVEFCDRLSQKTGRQYRLPSEAEWEYACRAGTVTPFHFGETITADIANFNGRNSYAGAPKGEFRFHTTDVGIFPPNAFGLYDMHGNVWEWCLDHWRENYWGAPNDGRAWLSNNTQAKRSIRGGSMQFGPEYCRSAMRLLRSDPELHFFHGGFRCVCSS